MTNERIEAAARAAHEANRVYCEALGDKSQGPWEETPENIRESARDGVRKVAENPAMTARAQHESWLEFKRRDGWVYGHEKSVESKTHPCMVPYDDLPKAQQYKDTIFGAVVRGVLGV